VGLIRDDREADPRGVLLRHEGVLAAVLLDGATTSSYSSRPADPGDGLRYAGAEPMLGWVAACTCGWRGPEYLAALHPPTTPLSGVAPPELDEAWWPAWDAHTDAILAKTYGNRRS
jgi:hypothetical protein